MKAPNSLETWLGQHHPDQAEACLKAFKLYQKELIKYNQHTNLTRIDEDDMEEKHFMDCLMIEPYLPFKAKVADVGSGAGFPGMVLAIVRPDCHFDLIEATGKRCTFLELIKDKLELNHVTIHHARVEDLDDLKNTYDVVTTRAVARLNVLLELCVPLLKVGGTCIAMKGSSAEDELLEAKSAMKALHLEAPILDVVELPSAGRHINLIFTKQHDSPTQYPRSYATIKKKAL
jgi:16S rRNA (guanine527-N7)-methyltransferase